MASRIAVLGRGLSLQIYRDYAHLFSKIYIVNNFKGDINEIGAQHLVGKEIIHVASRKGPNYLTKHQYKRLGVRRIQSNAFKASLVENRKLSPKSVSTMPSYMKDRGYEPYGWEKILKGEKGKKKSPNWRAWPTTGLLAIDLALVENKPDEIYLFGFDFYKKPYLDGHTKDQSEAKSQAMQMHLEKLVAEFHGTQFKCASDVQVDASNWENIKRNEDRWEMVNPFWLYKQQMYKGKPNRMDVVVRYLAIRNEKYHALYDRMQRVRMKTNSAKTGNRVKDLLKLIKSVESNGYINDKPIRISGTNQLVNGSHRLALAMAFNVPKILCWKDNHKKVVYNLKWFRKNGFSEDDIHTIEVTHETLLST